MSRYHYQWMKLHKETYREPSIARLTLAQQGIFYGLLQFAARQDEEGTFDDDNRFLLALEVAALDQDALRATIDSLLRDGVFIRVSASRLRVADYEQKYQWTWRTASSVARAPFTRGWRRLRELVLERDDYTCRSCGSHDRLEADHIFPIARGGTNDMENLQTLCRTCNRSKGARV